MLCPWSVSGSTATKRNSCSRWMNAWTWKYTDGISMLPVGVQKLINEATNRQRRKILTTRGSVTHLDKVVAAWHFKHSDDELPAAARLARKAGHLPSGGVGDASVGRVQRLVEHAIDKYHSRKEGEKCQKVPGVENVGTVGKHAPVSCQLGGRELLQGALWATDHQRRDIHHSDFCRTRPRRKLTRSGNVVRALRSDSSEPKPATLIRPLVSARPVNVSSSSSPACSEPMAARREVC